jgi:hypothetical protein
MATHPTNACEKFVDSVNSFRNGLRHIDERWKNSLSLNNATLIEKYLSGKFSIVLYFDAAIREVSDGMAAARYNLSRYIHYSIIVAVDRSDSIDALGDKDGDQESMLVTRVELAEGPQESVGSFVRAYLIGNERADARNGHLYGSVPALATSSAGDDFRLGAEGSYKFLPRLVHRKRHSGVLPAQNFAYGVVEGAAEIVHGVAKAQHQLGRKGLKRNDADKIPPFRVRLHHELAEIRFEEPLPQGVKLVDVMVGPFVL